ncbi:MAG TPA: alpha/beta hydrolase [Ktedonobacterales bacterium]|jgi:proline iminopeptidase
MEPTKELVAVPGATLWTARQGSGPALVLCHGGPGLWDYLGPVACMVDDLATVYRYDQRACGRSSGEADYDLAAAIADLEALRAHWGLASWIVGGHSAGATLALAYFLMYPRETAGLIYLCGTGLGDAWHAEYRANHDARLMPDERARLDELPQQRARAERDGNGAEYAALDREYCTLAWSTDLADRANARALARTLFVGDLLPNYTVNGLLGAALDRFTARADLPARLAALDLPALIVHGAGDPRPAWCVYQLAGLLPRARLAILPGAGHLPWLDGSTELRAVLRRFLARS